MEERRRKGAKGKGYEESQGERRRKEGKERLERMSRRNYIADGRADEKE